MTGQRQNDDAVTIACWELRTLGEPLVQAIRPAGELSPDEVLVRVAGCGVCHTDLGYIYDGVRTRHELPLTLGHEIAGTVERADVRHADLIGRAVVVTAVIPCGECELCRSGRGTICRSQIFPGCDVHGGFASHLVVPAHGVCVVDEEALARSDLELADLAVLGDAITTPYQAILRAGLSAGDVAIFVGAGGVGSFGVQIAAVMGAHVIAIDIDDERLERAAAHGASHTLNVRDLEPKAARKAVSQYVAAQGLPGTCWKIFETSGTAAGQTLAFSLLTFGAALGIVGYTLDTVNIRLSNLMAFDASANGSWGCLPEHYPAVLDLVLSGKVKVKPFIESRPMSRTNETIEALRAHEMTARPILIPDFE